MSWSDRVSIGLMAVAAVQMIISLRVWSGISARRCAIELGACGFVGAGETALWSGHVGSCFADSSAEGWVAHCAMATALVFVAFSRTAAFRLHQRKLEESIELLDRAIALKKTKPSAEDDSKR